MSRNTQWKLAGFGVSALVLILALVLANRTQEPPEAPFPELSDQDDFAREALAAIRAGDSAGEWSYDPERFLLQRSNPDGGQGMTLFLTNFHREYQVASPEGRGELLARLGRSAVLPETADTYARARSQMMLVVRARDAFEPFSQQAGESVPVSWRPVGEVLAEALVQDTPNAMRYVSREDLARWGVSYEQARADAMDNLRRLPAVPLLTLTLGACVFTTDDSYAASRLLLEDVVRGCEVRGDPVVLVPNRDVMFITGSEDATGLLSVAEEAEEALQAPRSVDGHALRLTADGWQPFLPGPKSPSRSILENLAFTSRLRSYREQTARLRTQYEQEHDKTFVASLLPEQNARGRFFGQAVWTNDGEQLLPRADIILFVDATLGPDAPPVAAVRWDLVVRDAGTLLMPELGMYPERYRVQGFPSKEQLQRWKADATAKNVP
jgi:uncharacterized protein YtpQ (UPF0354 family)